MATPNEKPKCCYIMCYTIHTHTSDSTDQKDGWQRDSFYLLNLIHTVMTFFYREVCFFIILNIKVFAMFSLINIAFLLYTYVVHSLIAVSFILNVAVATGYLIDLIERLTKHSHTNSFGINSVYR